MRSRPVPIILNPPAVILSPPTVILNSFQDNPQPARQALRVIPKQVRDDEVDEERYPLPMSKQPCVYILASGKRGYIYIGVTSDMVARYHQHQEGTFEGFAKRRNCKRLVRVEMFATMDEAIAREKQLKNWRRDWKINLVESENADWRDLGLEMGLR